MLTPLTKSLNSGRSLDDIISETRSSDKSTPLKTAPIFIPYLYLDAVRQLKIEYGAKDHCQRIFYSLIIYNALPNRDANEDPWFEFRHKQLNRYGNFGKDINIVRKYLKILAYKGLCSFRKRTLMGIDYWPKTFYFAIINDGQIAEDLKVNKGLTRETLLEPKRKMRYLPDYFKKVNEAASELIRFQPIPGGYIPYPDNPFIYLGEEGILIHPEMADYDSVSGTLDLTDNFESPYYRRKCRFSGQNNILRYSKLIKYIPSCKNSSKYGI